MCHFIGQMLSMLVYNLPPPQVKLFYGFTSLCIDLLTYFMGSPRHINFFCPKTSHPSQKKIFPSWIEQRKIPPRGLWGTPYEIVG